MPCQSYAALDPADKTTHDPEAPELIDALREFLVASKPGQGHNRGSPSPSVAACARPQLTLSLHGFVVTDEPTQAELATLRAATDGDLFAAVQDGSAAAFAELVDRYEGALRRTATARLGRADWAEEAVQETLLAVHRSAGTYNPQFALRTWLWTILLNQCRRLGRKYANRGEHDLAESDALDLPCRWPTPPERAIAKERRQLLDRLLRRLPEVESDALQLRFFGGMTFAEIAEATACSLLTAKNRVRRGLIRLSEMQLALQLVHDENPRGTSSHATASKPNRETPERSDRGAL